ncbi:D-alanyl-D-alanine carboxypeptidase [Clostridium sp. NSJ-145]|uniref:D-alanyl-D-alanine carboxypeptidase family protein n=1 Tax=Clostridium sp. NSJ-145 TaxID=2897777 RepID=UPI001E2A14F8|nr:serine hydrolase [Clostridium sp. NSJ-145]MCD2500440.1 D-alanyl-D-alanine carboxypeptidase [Clostridium sp. NSJ-145]
MTKRFFKGMVLLLCLTLILPFIGNIEAFASELQAPEIIGASSITMDIDTGEVIYSKNADMKRSPASTTKLLTSLLFAENKNKGDLISYTETSASLTETTLSGFIAGGVKPGDTMTADDVMKAVMIFSANDASVLMAESVAGSIEAFSKMMNEKAKELGALNSNFVSPNGLEDPTNPNNNNSTTAYDLALIGIAAYKNDWIRETMTLEDTPVYLNGGRIDLETRNKNLNKDGNVGGKTGTETLAGHCFVGFYNRDCRNLVTVVLGSDYGSDGTNVFNDTKAVADYSYEVSKVPYKTTGEEIGNVDLSYKLFKFFGPTKTITAPVILAQDVEYYKNDFNDTNANLSLSNTNADAWKVASNNSVDLTFSIGHFTETVKGTIALTTGQIFKANLPVYAAVIIGTIIAIVLIVIIVNLIRKSSRKNRRNRYYR